MFSFTIRGEAPFGSAPSLIILMSLQPAIPRQVALLQCLPPLHRPDSMFHLPAGIVNHHLTRAGEFSTGRTRIFQPELTPSSVASSDATHFHAISGCLARIEGELVGRLGRQEREISVCRSRAIPCVSATVLFGLCLSCPGRVEIAFVSAPIGEDRATANLAQAKSQNLTAAHP